jgi:benzodiazapine receptor
VRVFQIHPTSPRLSAALTLVGFVGLCLLVGASTSGLTAQAVRGWYLTLTPPPGTPPNWLFAPVWATLYVLIGIAAWLIWRLPAHLFTAKNAALRLWGWQLLANALWTPAFFGLHSTTLGLVVLLPLLVLIGLTIVRFARLRPIAAAMMAPYLLWSGYATYLNLGFWWLNRG